jgi:hypothetical protein
MSSSSYIQMCCCWDNCFECISAPHKQHVVIDDGCLELLLCEFERL